MKYIQWSETVKTINSIQVNRNTVRDFYITPKGTTIIENICLPSNPFKKSFTFCWIDLLWSKDVDLNKLVTTYNGKVIEAFYSDNLLTAQFVELEDAFNFVEDNKEYIKNINNN